MFRSLMCSVAAMAIAANAHAGSVAPFVWSLSPDPATVVIREDTPASHTVVFTVYAAMVGGIGSVSGFDGVGVQTNNSPGAATLSAHVLAPFTGLAPSNGTTGDGVSGVAGGQFVFPPAIPIDPSLALFTLTYEEHSFDTRTVELTLSGLGGIFLSSQGASTVPFLQIPEGVFRFSVVAQESSAIPLPKAWSLGAAGLMAMVIPRRRALLVSPKHR